MIKNFTVHKTGMAGLLLVILGALAGAITGAGLAQPEAVVVIDDRGREIAVPQPVERIVVAGTPLYSEILVDIGALSQIVGVTASPDNPIEVKDIASVGDSLQPNIEEIIALEPDVVFGAVFGVRDQLEGAGIIVVTPVSFITKLPDTFKIIRDVGRVTGHAERADALIGQISESVVSIESLVAQETRPRAAFLFSSATDSPPYAAGKGSVEGEILARAGGENLFGDVEGGNLVSFESLLERDPEYIFVDPSQVQFISENPVLAEVSAVKNGRVIGIKASMLTSTRVTEALRAMAEALHPAALSPNEGK